MKHVYSLIYLNISFLFFECFAESVVKNQSVIDLVFVFIDRIDCFWVCFEDGCEIGEIFVEKLVNSFATEDLKEKGFEESVDAFVDFLVVVGYFFDYCDCVDLLYKN